MGFGVPVGNWFRGEMKGFVRESLLSEKSLGRGIVKLKFFADTWTNIRMAKATMHSRYDAADAGTVVSAIYRLNIYEGVI